MSCPDDNTLVAYGAGALAEAEARALEEHLEGCAGCRALAAEAALQTAGAPGLDAWGGEADALEDEEALEVAPGALLGRYVVLERAGAGGMGTVFLAYDPQLERKVALKLLHPAPGGSTEAASTQERLLREAQAMARLTHPNVVAVHDVGAWRRRVFLAMEYVDGATLRRWLREGPPPFAEVLAALVQAGRGLAAAHAAGLVHRDFKPDNVLVGRGGRVCVTDFGLARAPGGRERPALPDGTREERSASLTRTGTLVGTPAYMAPEQYLGQAAEARSDQFSFCITAWEAFTGTRPYDVDGLRQLAFARKTGGRPPAPPAPPSRLPQWLARCLLRGLAADPAERFPTMEALLHALERQGRTRRLRLAVAAGATLLVLGGGTAVAVEHQRARAALCSGGPALLEGVWDVPSRQALTRAFADTGVPEADAAATRVGQVLDGYAQAWLGMHREACEATRLRGEQPEPVLALRMLCLERRRKELRNLVGLFQTADAPLVRGAQEAALGLPGVRQCADVQALLEPVPLPESPQAREAIAAVDTQLAEVNALRLAGRFTPGLEKARLAWEAARPLGHRPLEAEALYLRGFLEHRLGQREEGERTLVEAALAADAGRDDVLRARAALRLAYLLGQQSRLGPARTWVETARAALERLGGHRELEGELHDTLGTLLLVEGRYQEALEAYQHAQRLLTAELGRAHPKWATTLSNTANVLQRLGRPAEALPMLQEALALLEQLRGAEHPALVGPLVALASTQMALRDFAAAHARIDRALAITRARSGGAPARVGELLDFKATAFQEEGRWEEALATYRTALALKLEALGPQHPDLSYSYDGIGQALLGLGRPTEALAPLERALQLRGPDPYDLAETRFALARALWSRREARRRARALAQQAQADYARAEREDRAGHVRAWLEGRR